MTTAKANLMKERQEKWKSGKHNLKKCCHIYKKKQYQQR